MSARVLQLGDKGPEVSELQRRLGLAGFITAQDGQFGEKTQAAVEAFQRANGLDVDGEVGFRTRAALAWPFEIAEEDTDPAAELLGVDVSEAQPVSIWPAVAAAGYKFAIVKALGLKPDPKFKAHVLGARAAGVEVVGSYGWLPENVDPRAHARQLVDMAVGWCCLDYEPAKGAHFKDDKAMAQKAAAYLDELGGGILYTAPYVLHAAPFDYGCPLWIAGPADAVKPYTWTLWQREQAEIGGVKVDVDVFRGDMAALRGLAGRTE